ncbi:type I toxin-antitoxin system SymE family toxin [Xanthomonas campestris pv. campestris]|uniref:SymE family type I addiction module toxin n=1 Tax=Xanthomonas campestris TaxID=339 RepID=UPI002378F468|nr:SymE family type I addiction module toxin [Xanthomonas campestris]MDO0788247.1 type I toxin-antitoxin system SymE family toxin [Xanthomonas campestris pv. campestris]MDO0837554.1 type I toxin-antitoxin system SymE family toxin [Xanthomonas campestris pv. campestris]WDK51410.1 type I toxin-antitoxin system SymE family toxin [Xanthomonas campestris pv. campestris]WDK52341.1 type I toxin-antitoxin system SymE family toxin [Xanthomonas campestris pv. campestris]WDL61168.1 type I toxin-antitoxin
MTRRRPPTASASARPTRTRARTAPSKRVQWVVVEPDRITLPPMLPPDPDTSPQGAGTLRAPRRARRPRQCTVSYTHYPGAHGHAGDQHVPHVRLSGLWLEQLGFAIGTKLRITASAGQLLMEVLPPVEVPAKARSVRR